MTKEELKAKRNEVVINTATIGHGLGFAYGMYVAYKGKKKFWGYVGRGLLFGIIFSAVALPIGYGIAATVKDKDNDEQDGN